MSDFIPFNLPFLSGNEIEYMSQSLTTRKLSGGHDFSQKCSAWFNDHLNSLLSIPTPSCTAALEMGLMIIDIQAGDEVIVPSYTFTSTATAIVLHGGVPVFIDVEPNSLNMNADLIEGAITDKTKAIIPVHYNGVSCDMDKIMQIAANHDLIVLEDAAQCVYAQKGDIFVGSQGHMSAFSFHETKNLNSGEGGMLCINDKSLTPRAEIIRDKGTNRQEFMRGEVDKYSWQGKGSSYLLSDPQCAFLLSQLEKAEEVTNKHREIWRFYASKLAGLKKSGLIEFAEYQDNDIHNAHLFYILMPTAEESEALRLYLKDNNVQLVSHYIPLHSAPAGLQYGRIASDMDVSNDLPFRLLRLPMFYDLTMDQAATVCQKIHSYFDEK